MNPSEPSTPFTPEQLMAYADGELPAAEAARIREAAQHDAALAQRIAGFTRTGRALSASFAGKLAEPVPEHLLALLAAPAEQSPRVQSLRPAKKPLVPEGSRWWPMALAAGIALAIGLSINLPRGTSTEPAGLLLAGLPADAAGVSKLLDITPSGEPATLQVAQQQYELLPTASYRSAGGQWCREFTASDVTHGGETYALACREEGRWAVQLATAASHVGALQDEGYFPAGAEPAGSARKVLDSAAERAAIAAGWR